MRTVGAPEFCGPLQAWSPFECYVFDILATSSATTLPYVHIAPLRDAAGPPLARQSRMPRILYIVGAGFSAPLQLPLVANFFEKSHLQHDREPQRFAYFEEVFTLVRELARAKNYYRTDLFNIEEILSLVALRSRLGARGDEALFQRYIRDVIQFYTPSVSPALPDSAVLDLAFGAFPCTAHVAFVACLLGLTVNRMPDASSGRYHYRVVDGPEPANEYAVISLNYDMVLENCATFLHDHAGSDRRFIRSGESDDVAGFGGHLAKLHGSVDDGPIVPPTWSKTLENESIAREWQHATHLLAKAQHIRVIGYSLPTADSYVRYLLRSAAIDAKYLARFDVVTLDSRGEFEQRYRDFVDFHGFRFENKSTEVYLSHLLSKHGEQSGPYLPGTLEIAHRNAFRSTVG